MKLQLSQSKRSLATAFLAFLHPHKNFTALFSFEIINREISHFIIHLKQNDYNNNKALNLRSKVYIVSLLLKQF